jgi:ABC-type phosphate transport system substrate-binding protein
MMRGRGALKLMVLTACIGLLGCSNTPSAYLRATNAPRTLNLYSANTTPLVARISQHYSALNPQLLFEINEGNHQQLTQNLLKGEIPYFITVHLETTQGWWAAPLAQDALVLISHPLNPVDNLSLEQARALFQGQIQRWDELGGEPLPVLLYSREAGAGVRTEFEARLLGNRRISPNARQRSSDEALLETVSRQRGALAYVPYSLLGLLNERVKPIALDGVLPTQDSIAQGLYPLRLTVYIVGWQEPQGDLRQFVGWIQSKEGQSIVAECCIPLPP